MLIILTVFLLTTLRPLAVIAEDLSQKHDLPAKAVGIAKKSNKEEVGPSAADRDEEMDRVSTLSVKVSQIVDRAGTDICLPKNQKKIEADIKKLKGVLGVKIMGQYNVSYWFNLDGKVTTSAIEISETCIPGYHDKFD